MPEPRYPLTVRLYGGRIRHMARTFSVGVVVTACGKRGPVADEGEGRGLCERCAEAPNPIDCRSYPTPASGMPHTPAPDPAADALDAFADLLESLPPGGEALDYPRGIASAAFLAREEAYRIRPAEAAPYTPRPAPEAAAPALAAEERGTGERNPHARSEAVAWGQGADCPHRPEWHCETHGECRGCECGCDTVNPEPDREWITIPAADATEEWGVRRRDGRVLRFEDRDDAEAFADGWRGGERTVVRRSIGPWEPVPSLPVPSSGEGTTPDYRHEPEGATDD